MTLRAAMRECEAHFGPAFMHDRARWGTADGGVPYLILWEHYHHLHGLRARERLSMARAALVTRVDPQRLPKVLEDMTRDAYESEG